MTISIEEFYKTNIVPLSFNEKFYANRFLETKEFYQPYCIDNNIDEKHRLYYHYKLFFSNAELSDIDLFYINHSIDNDFDEDFYEQKNPHVKGFYESYCSQVGIDKKHRLYYHWFIYNCYDTAYNYINHYKLKWGFDFSQLHTNDIEKFWPIDEQLLPETEYYNHIGKIKAKSSSIVIIGLARNIEKYIDRSIQQLLNIAESFKEYKICIYENDSVDQTREKLNTYQDKISIIGENDNSQYLTDFSVARTTRMARYRNICFDWVKNNALSYDYVLVVDLDADGGFSVEGIFNSIFWLSKINNAGCMGSYSYKVIDLLKEKNIYHYDTFAFRLNHSTNNDSSWAANLTLKVGSVPIKVNSCFGGLALYKKEAFLSGKYDGEDCEHVTFHNSLAKNGWDTYLNPTSRFCAVVDKDDFLNINKLKIVNTYQDNTGLGLVNKDLNKWCKSHNFDKLFIDKAKTIIPGRPDEYVYIEELCQLEQVIFWTTFESSIFPKNWVDNLNKTSEVLVPHKAIANNLKKSGVNCQISVVEQPFQRHERTTLLVRKPKIINIGFNGLPTNRKNVTKLIEALKLVNQVDKKFHLYIKIPYAVNNDYKNLIDDNITIEIGDFTERQMAEWYSKLNAYIFPSSGEGWSFTPRESLYLGIPTVITDIDVHQELLPYSCCITNKQQKELAYYEFCQAFHGYQNQYSIENIVDALNDLFDNYTKYLDLAQNGSKWISDLWTQQKIYNKLFSVLEPENLIICPSQHTLCGLNDYTESLSDSLGNFKYISKPEDIYAYNLNNIKNIHIQHEWSLYDHDTMISLIKSLPPNINKQITLHSVIRDNPSHQREIIDTFDEVYSLCSRAKSIDSRIKYVKHGGNPSLYCGNKDMVSLNKDSKIIGTFGFLHQNKGYEYVADALAQTHYLYKIIATHKNSENSILLEKKLRSNSHIILDTSYHNMADIFHIMSDCKALIFYYEEDKLFFTSGAVLQAGRFGLPIITSDECMFDDLGDAVYRVEKNNLNELVNAIAKLSDLDFCKSLVSNMNKLLVDRDWNILSKQYE